MRTNILRSVAMTLGLGLCGAAQAQYGGYPAMPGYGAGNTVPAASQNAVPLHPSLQQQAHASAGAAGLWNNYQPPQQPSGYPGVYGAPAPHAAAQPSATFRTASARAGQGGEPLPLPPQAHGKGVPTPAVPQPVQDGGGYGAAGHGPSVGSVYHDAMAAPWAGSGHVHHDHGASLACSPAPLRNWFAGGNVLFLDVVDECEQRLLFDVPMPSTTMLDIDDVSPGGGTGYDLFFGRYLGCGQYGLMVNYFNFDPSGEERIVSVPAGGDYRPAMRNWDRISLDTGVVGDATDDQTLYALFDNSTAYRARRDMSFQGIELNLVSFGLGGASRIGFGAGDDCNSCGPNTACGGACGPLVPGCSGRLQFQTTHGLRWFQFKDAFEFAASQAVPGYGTTQDDLYYNVNTENDLFGYQFGSRMNYCLGKKLNLYAGGKFGIYANDVDYRSRIGSTDMPGYVNSYYPSIQGQGVDGIESETVLATLGELDLGLGYRIHNCWSVVGGYRLYGLSGVATATGSISDDLANLSESRQVCADDSMLIHGGYVGLNYNW